MPENPAENSSPSMKKTPAGIDPARKFLLYLFPTISFVSLIVIGYFDVVAIVQMFEGDHSWSTAVGVVLYSLLIFIILSIFTVPNARKLAAPHPSPLDTEDQLKIKIYKTVNLSDKPLSHSIIKKCYTCGFENSPRATRCTNCGRPLN
jgi:hypothetical protein